MSQPLLTWFTRVLGGAILVLMITSCKYDDSNREALVIEGDLLVAIDTGEIQCETEGLSPLASLQTLIDAGIDVKNTHCGYIGAAITLCGVENNAIIAHQISIANLPDAEALGYWELTEVGSGIDDLEVTLYECD